MILDKNERLSSRNVLWILAFTGFAVNYMTRIHLNIAIVSMVLPRPKSNITLTSECITTSQIVNDTVSYRRFFHFFFLNSNPIESITT